MVDVVDIATRSRMMSGIHGKNTKPEILVRSMLHRQGFRFRLHDRKLPGKPDIVFPRYHAVIFVNGCFWHGHECRLFKWPETRSEFWRKKIMRNRYLDHKSQEALLTNGWRVGIVWECTLRAGKRNPVIIAQGLTQWLRSNEPFKENWE
ncbi:MAG: DNA mismatch endonuclease Vsr [Desulfobulbaceae bacterium]|nr:DNA mismatch endonuclease Vsr [Desulfobulbaceae bacterium]